MKKTNNLKVVLVTGANKGIGFELCRQLAEKKLRVILTARNARKGQAALASLKKSGFDVNFHQLEVTDSASIGRAYDWVLKKYGRLDYLVNNAGIMADVIRRNPNEKGASIFKAKIETLRESLETNTFGAIRMAQKFVPLMKKSGSGRIVNITSGMGQLSKMNGGWPGYRISKTALNAVTRILADELSATQISVVSLCPGWVKTDMGGQDAELEVEKAVGYIVQTLLVNKQTGVYLRFGKRIAW